MSTKLKIRWSRTIPLGAKVTSVTVSKDKANRYFISFACEDTIAQLPKTENKVGIDLGMKDFAVLSTGEKIEHPKYYRTSEKRLVKCQRELSKKQKGSKNREKARVKVAKAYAKVTDQRKDFLHKLSSRLVSENQVICIEDLAVKNMVKNRHLSKSISDSGWGEFKRQLEYKSVWHGRTLVKVGRFFPSSKTCSTCGCIKDHLDLSERNWTCQHCGTEHDRDVNAALNVLAEGTSVIARGEESSGSSAVRHLSETGLCEAGIPVL
jgi:putative transposase